MQDTNPHLSPEQARHLTIHGSNQNEDGTYTWKFDNYTRTPRLTTSQMTTSWRSGNGCITINSMAAWARSDASLV